MRNKIDVHTAPHTIEQSRLDMLSLCLSKIVDECRKEEVLSRIRMMGVALKELEGTVSKESISMVNFDLFQLFQWLLSAEKISQH